MPWQFGNYPRRLFQQLFFSMDDALTVAKIENQRVRSQDPKRPELFDQLAWRREKAASRECLVMGIAGIESLANSLLAEFSIFEKEDLDQSWLDKYLRKQPIDRWPLSQKVYFTPTLCNSPLIGPSRYFKQNSKTFRVFEELVEIRNSIVHGRPWPKLVLFKLNPNKFHTMNDSFPDQYWPISHIHKDLVSFNFDYAKQARDNIAGIRNSLIKFVPKAGKRYLTEEKIHLVSQVIKDNEVDEEELMINWRRYVDPKKIG